MELQVVQLNQGQRASSAESSIWKAEICIITCHVPPAFRRKTARTPRVDNGRLFRQGKEIKGKDTNSVAGYSKWLACCELNSLTPVKLDEWAVGTAAPSPPPLPVQPSPAQGGRLFSQVSPPHQGHRIPQPASADGTSSPRTLLPWGGRGSCWGHGRPVRALAPLLPFDGRGEEGKEGRQPSPARCEKPGKDK